MLKIKIIHTFGRLVLILFLFLVLVNCESRNANSSNKVEGFNALQYVDPFIGTGFHGHTFPGATTPFGGVQLSPDTRVKGWDACSGYHYSDSTIIGFSHTHLSGTGIGDLGDILMMPFTGSPSIKSGSIKEPDTGYRSRFKKENEKASPGYYSVILDDYNVKAELTATAHTGVHRYTFPESEKAGIIVDLEHTIREHENLLNEIRIINDHEIEGLKYTSGWAEKQKVYFRATFSKSFEVEVYKKNELIKNEKHVSGNSIKLKLKFNTEADEEVIVKIGISSVDFDGAHKNLKKELQNKSFDQVVDDGRKLWQEQLKKVKVEGKSESDKRIFYTALYHTSIAPNQFSDVDGRYRGMDRQIHQSETTNYTVFSLWDTYRALHPLFTITKPKFNEDLIKSLLRKYEEGGILPMWELSSNYTGTMIGSHAVSVIADAYMKGYRDFDEELALEAMVNAMAYDTLSPIRYEKKFLSSNLMPKAKYLIKEYGFVPADMENASVSMGLEYAYNYWCIARMAKEMGKDDIASEYFKLSTTYKNYYDKKTGFMRGKNSDGEFKKPFNPKESSHWTTPYVEGNAWQWTWYVPHDVDGLIELFNGKENFSAKLDSLFTTSSELTGEKVSGDITGLIGQYAHGNEPSHHIAYLYNYVNQPWKTQKYIRQIVHDFYTDQPDGLIGNEDCGQMSAWYILNAMGFYPIAPGDPRYSIGMPLFEEVKIKVTNGKEFWVSAKHLSEKNKYVQKVLLNGKPLKQPFIHHKDIVAGKHLEFIMGNTKTVFWE